MILIYIFILGFGLIIGSFLNALIWRLHSGESMMERSCCPHCHQLIAWYDNIPVLSFLWLAGKCRHCHQQISWQYPVVELITALLFLVAYLSLKVDIYSLNLTVLLGLVRAWFIIAVMIIVFVYDLRWYLILDKVVVPASLILFAVWLATEWLSGGVFTIEHWTTLLVAIAVGVGFFGVQYLVSSGKWIGGGDVKLGLVLALALGWPKVLGAIFIAYLLGSAVGLSLVAVGRKDLGSKLPFGTFLSVATIIMLFWGEGIVSWYLRVLGF